MTSTVRSCGTAALAIALAGGVALIPDDALAQAKDASKGRIVCWKDKTGKVIGCGDKVPPEHQDSATREVDRTGVTRKTTESAEEAAKRRAQEQEAARLKAEEDKRLAEQRRQDSALLSTFTSEKEIDQKRDRDLQQLDIQMSQMKVSLKNTNDRYNEVKGRVDAAGKSKGGVTAALQEELTKADADRQRAEQNIASKEKEKEDVIKRYAEQKKRYLELRGESAPATEASLSRDAVPAKNMVPAKDPPAAKAAATRPADGAK